MPASVCGASMRIPAPLLLWAGTSPLYVLPGKLRKLGHLRPAHRDPRDSALPAARAPESRQNGVQLGLCAVFRDEVHNGAEGALMAVSRTDQVDDVAREG